MGWGDQYAPLSKREREAVQERLKSVYAPKLAEQPTERLRAAKAALEAELGIPEGDDDAGWVRKQLDRRRRYQLFVQSRAGGFTPRTEADRKAIKLAEIEFTLAQRSARGRGMAVK